MVNRKRSVRLCPIDLVSQFVGFYGVPNDLGSREIAQNPDHGDQELDLVVFEALLLLVVRSCH